MRRILPLLALLALTACVQPSPENIAAHADALAVARARYPLTPQLRVDIAKSVLHLMNPLSIPSLRSISAPMISNLSTYAGYKNVFGVDRDPAPFYCVHFLGSGPLMLGEEKFFLKVDVVDASAGVLKLTAHYGVNSEVQCASSTTFAPFPELEALNPR